MRGGRMHDGHRRPPQPRHDLDDRMVGHRAFDDATVDFDTLGLQ